MSAREGVRKIERSSSRARRVVVVLTMLGSVASGFAVAAAPPVFVSPYPCFLTMADIDGDGLLEYMLLDRLSHTLFLMTREGVGGWPVVRPLVHTPRTISISYCLGDFDEDGRVDVVVAEGPFHDPRCGCGIGATIVLLLNRGAAGWSRSSVFEFPEAIYRSGGRHLAVADFNGDGHLDVVGCFRRVPFDVVSSALLLGDGKGSFAEVPGALTTQVPDPAHVVALDFDADGNQDVCIVSFVPDALTVGVAEVQLNPSGDGRFLLSDSREFSGTPSDVVAVDANGDDGSDLAVLLTDLWVYILPGDGDRFDEGFSLPQTGDWPKSICAADFDQDRRLDLAVGYREAPAIDIFWGGSMDGNSVPTAVPEGPRVYALAAADHDGDGRTDLFVAHGRNYHDETGTAETLAIHRNLGGGTFERVPWSQPEGRLSFTERSIPGPGGATVESTGLYFVLGDCDGDGDRDIFATNTSLSKDSVTVFRNDGDGRIATGPVVELSSQIWGWISALDIDNDGTDEVIVPGHVGEYLSVYSTKDGWASSRETRVSLPSPYNYGLAPGDFNQDGLQDVAVSTGMGAPVKPAVRPPDGIHILLGTLTAGVPGFAYGGRIDFPDLTLEPGYLFDFRIRVVGSGFYDGDAFPDLVVRGTVKNGVTAGSPLVVLRGDQSLEFSERINLCGVYMTGSLAFADIDGDRRADIITNGDGYGPAVYLHGQEIPDQYGASFGFCLTTADFDRDGFDDAASFTARTVVFYRGGADGVLRTDGIVEFEESAIRYTAYAADFNGDGWADIAYADITDNTIHIVLNDGARRFVRGDANGDDHLDLADPIMTLNYLFVPGMARPACEDAMDINDDGRLDIGDAVRLLNYLFSGGPNPLPPFPEKGLDPTDDPLRC